MMKKLCFGLVWCLCWSVTAACQPTGPKECKEICKDGASCVDGICIDKDPGPPCGKDCGAQKCDTTKRKCVDCLTSADCSRNKICVQDVCKKDGLNGCDTDDDCKNQPKKYCSNGGQCEWSCTKDDQCSANEQCKDYICKLKPECSTDEECKTKGKFFCSDRGKCDWTCTTDSHCANNQECKDNLCTPKVDTCKTDTDCQEATLPKCKVDTGKCVACLADPDCKDKTLICKDFTCETDPSTVCTPACQTGETCVKSKCVPDATPCTPACQAGESCIQGKCTKAPLIKECEVDADCDTGQSCYRASTRERGFCGKICKVAADCGTDATCYAGKTCIPTCDPTIATLFHPSCPSWMFCSPSSVYKPGFCKPLPLERKGVKQFQEACDEFGTANELCDTSKGLFCDHHVCQRACDLRKGNADCGTDEICQESTQNSHLGGHCTPPRTQASGEVCGNNGTACAQGLYCSGLPTKTCLTTRNCLTCAATCDPKKGHVGNPDCPANNRCIPSAEADQGGYCTDFGQVRQGPNQLGAACDIFNAPAGYCDGAKGLVCLTTGTSAKGTCVKGCNPTNGNKDCDSGKICHEDAGNSHLGGFCVAPGTKQLDESCGRSANSERCISTLHCAGIGYSSIFVCHQPCDPTQNQCPAGQTCELTPSSGISVCTRPRNATRIKNESCLTGGPADDSSYDCDAGLACASDTRSCIDATPQDHICTGSSCGAGMVCAALPFVKRRPRCRPLCNPTSPTCATGTACVNLHQGYPGFGACLPLCKDSADCQTPGTICQSATASVSVCH